MQVVREVYQPDRQHLETRRITGKHDVFDGPGNLGSKQGAIPFSLVYRYATPEPIRRDAKHIGEHSRRVTRRQCPERPLVDRLSANRHTAFPQGFRQLGRSPAQLEQLESQPVGE